MGLSRNGFGKKGLPRSRRSNQQDTLRNLTPQGPKPVRGLEEIDDLLQLLLRLIHTGHVIEGNLRLILHIDPRLALPDGHETTPGSGPHPSKEVTPNPEEDEHRNNP